MRRYLLTDEAKGDLSEIRSYLKREAGPHVAKSVLKKLREAFLLLGRTPGIGHIRDDLTEEPLKFWAVFSYLIVYDAAKRPIEIIRVLHGRRDVAAILEKD